jgi:hypothetical protein
LIINLSNGPKASCHKGATEEYIKYETATLRPSQKQQHRHKKDTQRLDHFSHPPADNKIQKHHSNILPIATQFRHTSNNQLHRIQNTLSKTNCRDVHAKDLSQLSYAPPSPGLFLSGILPDLPPRTLMANFWHRKDDLVGLWPPRRWSDGPDPRRPLVHMQADGRAGWQSVSAETGRGHRTTGDRVSWTTTTSTAAAIMNSREHVLLAGL